MLRLLKKLKELVFGKTTPEVIEAPKVEVYEVKPTAETLVVEEKVVATKKKFKHKTKPQPKNS